MLNKTPFTAVVAVSTVLLAIGLSTATVQEVREGTTEINSKLKDFSYFWTSNESYNGTYGPSYSTMDYSEQGFVNLGALQSFTANLTAQAKEDVLDSILLAQLTASHMYNRETEYAEWYRIYVEALVKLGWMVDSYRFFQYTPPSTTINLAEDTLRIIRLLCVKPNLQFEATRKVLQAYQDLLSSDPRVQMFNNHTMLANGGLQASFQVLPATAIWNRVTSIVFSNFHFSSQKQTYRYLSFFWEAPTAKLQAAVSVGSLNHTEYAVYRKAVKKQLGNAAEKFVKEIPTNKIL